MPLGRCGVETVQGVGSLPTLRAMVRAWPRQRRNAQPLIRSRADHTTHATAYKLSAVAAEFSGCVGGGRRNRVRTVRFHCSTFPNRTRCAGLRSGLGMTTEGVPSMPHSYWPSSKTKERRVSHDRLPDSKKGLCPRGSGVPHGKGQGRLSPEIRWKRPHLPMGGLRPLRRSMIDKEIYIWQRKSSTGGPMEPW